MEKMILKFPEQFKIGIEAAKNIKLRKRFKKVCICGMGGSALPANLLSMILEEYKLKLPLIIQRDYFLPSQVDKDTLIVLISYSGNTEETISCLKDALSKKLEIVIITSNGKLENFAKKYSIFYALIPKGLPPRMALGYQFSALLGILVNCHLLPKSLIDKINDLEKRIDPKKFQKEGKKLAQKLFLKIPIIYASNRLKHLARIWKIKFNENTKIPAFWNFFPELNHNEMVGFENLKEKMKNCQFFLLILEDKDDYPKNKKRMRLTLEILKKHGIEGEILKLKGKDFLERIFASIILSDWTSFYLAKHYGVDPVLVKMVEEFKKKIKE